jgi:hypothetical protein
LSLARKAEKLLVGRALAGIRYSPMGPREVDLPRLGERLLRKRRTRLEEPADSRGKKSAASPAVAAEG